MENYMYTVCGANAKAQIVVLTPAKNHDYQVDLYWHQLIYSMNVDSMAQEQEHSIAILWQGMMGNMP